MRLTRKQLRRLILEALPDQYTELIYDDDGSVDADATDAMKQEVDNAKSRVPESFQAASDYIKEFWTGDERTPGAFQKRKLFRDFKGALNDDEQGAAEAWINHIKSLVLEKIQDKEWYLLDDDQARRLGAPHLADYLEELQRAIKRIGEEINSVRANRVSWHAPHGVDKWSVDGKYFDI